MVHLHLLLQPRSAIWLNNRFFLLAHLSCKVFFGYLLLQAYRLDGFHALEFCYHFSIASCYFWILQEFALALLIPIHRFSPVRDLLIWLSSTSV